ncbi:P-loop containing nucleoside triphosphate hydrolase protein [Blastocladiella britannica]|nr:P-loop containing nucleoside triphosphate hydrolase protein [Blastocladiella britannica]
MSAPGSASSSSSRVFVAVRVRPPRVIVASEDANSASAPMARSASPSRPRSPSSSISAQGRNAMSHSVQQLQQRAVDVEDCVTVKINNRNTAISERWAVDSGAVVAGSTRFQYDRAFGEKEDQQTVYEETAGPLVRDFLAGYNCTVFAYGQTGSGKTHTMGTEASSVLPNESGIVPRTLREIFKLLEDGAETKGEFRASMSMIEIYNEEILDLLKPAGAGGRPLQLREDSAGIVQVIGATEPEVLSYKDCLCSTLEQGFGARSTGMTAMNARSSRSHAILTLHLSQRPSATTRLTSKFHFVDLAGSERVNKSATIGDRRREGIAINQGLLALGQVIHALADSAAASETSLAAGPSPHIPYRDSKLTRVLQSSLGGNARTVMVACVSPEESDAAESIATLRYAGRALAIRNKAVANVGVEMDSSAAAAAAARLAVTSLMQENAELKAMLARLTGEARSAPFSNGGAARKPTSIGDAEFYAQFAALSGRWSKLRDGLDDATVAFKLGSSPTSRHQAWGLS